MKGVKSPLAWIGGKAKYAERIIRLMPEHTVYVEVFGGGGSVLCRKAPSLGEVYNDIDEEVVNFFRVARDHMDKLQARLQWVPYSRQEFVRFRELWRSKDWEKLGEVDRAVVWYAISRQAFSATMRSPSWGYTTWRGGKSGGWQPDTFVNTVEGLLIPFRNRLRHVQIEHLDFDDCIRRYDGIETLFYCDPPYVGTEDCYRVPFGEADHRRLAELLHRVKAKVIVSYEDHPLVSKLYSGWRREEFSAVRHSQKTRIGERKKVATEVVLMNW